VNVYLEKNPIRDAVDIWLFERIDSGARILRLAGPDTWQFEEVPGPERGEPTLTLRTDWAEALSGALGDVLPPSAAVAAHLLDARAVRDRLLAIVEHAEERRS
jgi:hypothetical protein